MVTVCWSIFFERQVLCQLKEEVALLLLIHLNLRVIHLSRVRTKGMNWQFSPFCAYLVMSVTCCTPHLYSHPLNSVTPCRTSAIRGGDKNVVHILGFKINDPITTDIYVTKAWIVLSLDELNSPLVIRFCCWAGFFSHSTSLIGKWHCYPWCL